MKQPVSIQCHVIQADAPGRVAAVVEYVSPDGSVLHSAPPIPLVVNTTLTLGPLVMHVDEPPVKSGPTPAGKGPAAPPKGS